MRLLKILLLALAPAATSAQADELDRCDALTDGIDAHLGLEDPDGLRTANLGVSLLSIREACGQALALGCALGPEPAACLAQHTTAVDVRLTELIERIQAHAETGAFDSQRVAEVAAKAVEDFQQDRIAACQNTTSTTQDYARSIGLDLGEICLFEASVGQWASLEFMASTLDQANPEGAIGLNRRFLEQPGMVWVPEDIPLAVKEGLLIPLIPYVTFAGGEFESGFMSGLPYIADAACEVPFECDNRTAQGVNRRGSYTVGGGRITIDAAPLNDWTFDRDEITVQASAVFAGGSQLARRDGDVLVLGSPAGDRRFHAVPAAEARDALNLAVTFEVPAGQTYACTFRALQALKAKPLGELTDDERAILATAHYGREIMPHEHLADVLNPDGFGRQNPPSPRELEQYTQARAISIGVRVAFTFTVQEMDPGSAEPVQIIEALSQEQLDRIALFQGRILETAPDPGAAQAEIDRISAHVPLAAYATARVLQIEGDYTDSYLAYVCGE